MPEIVGSVPTAGPSAATATAPSGPKEALGKDAFLQLLVAQLKYQNPLAPSDGTQFLAQTAQFTMVEKLEEIARANAELLSTSRSLAASGLVGRQVVALTSDGEVTGPVRSVRLDPTGPVLRVGESDVPLAAVKEVLPLSS